MQIVHALPGIKGCGTLLLPSLVSLHPSPARLVNILPLLLLLVLLQLGATAVMSWSSTMGLQFVESVVLGARVFPGPYLNNVPCQLNVAGIL